MADGTPIASRHVSPFCVSQPCVITSPRLNTPSHWVVQLASQRTSSIKNNSSAASPVSCVQPFEQADKAFLLDHEIARNLPHCLSIFTFDESEKRSSGNSSGRTSTLPDSRRHSL